jgi:hypothetical protein
MTQQTLTILRDPVALLLHVAGLLSAQSVHELLAAERHANRLCLGVEFENPIPV